MDLKLHLRRFAVIHRQSQAGRVELCLLAFGVILLLSAVVSSVVIVFHHPKYWDFTGDGFNNAFDQFKFPIACFAGTIAVETIRTSIGALIQSARQSAAAAWALTQSNFITYTASQRNLPLYVLSDDPFAKKFDRRFGSTDELFKVTYQMPTTTLRRLYDMTCDDFELEPCPSSTLLTQLKRIDDHYQEFRRMLAKGDEMWLPEFADLALAVRQLRLYLAVTAGSMKEWEYPPYLREVKEFGSERLLPPFETNMILGIAGNIWMEMLCIVDVLQFSQRLQTQAQCLRKAAFSVHSLKDKVYQDQSMKEILEKNSLDVIWREGYKIEGRCVNI